MSGKQHWRRRRWWRDLLLIVQLGRCAQCGRRVWTKGTIRWDVTYWRSVTDLEQAQATLDHVIPLSRGGRDSVENYQVLCRRCNGSKADRL